MATKIQLLRDLGSDVLNLIELGFLKPDSAKNPSAVKSAQTKYEKSLKASPAVRRREEQRLSGDTEFSGIDFGERNIVGIEGLLGSTLVPIFGDKTSIGAVNQLKGLKLDSPIESHGGVNFSQQHQGSGRGWMSMEKAAKGKQSNIDFAADRTNNNDVVGVYTAGADPSFSFAAPTAELMMAQTLAAKVPKKSKAAFDAELRSVRPGWVGLDDPRALDQLLGKGEFAREGSGALRIDFVDTMDKAKYRDMGFGIRQDAVNAITQPGLENVARGDSGFGLMQAIPGAKTFREEGIHQSYDTVIPGDYRGGLVDSLPANVMFPDTFRWMQSLGRQPSSQLGSLMMDPKLYQRADEGWLESVSRYLETGIPDVPIKSVVPAAGALGLLAAPEDAEAGFVNRGGRTLLEAFHGSPHQFDRFDMSKIGTGEGAQAYGHGLYFTDTEDIAKQYRDSIVNHRPLNMRVDGKGYGDMSGPEYRAAAAVEAEFRRDPSISVDEAYDRAIKGLKDQQSKANKPELYGEDIDDLVNLKGRVDLDKGHLYRTEIDVTPESLLDWDKPLSEQGGVVKDAAQNYFDLFRKDEGIADYLDPIFNDEYEGMTGKEFYQTLQNLYSEGYLETPIGNTLADDALMRGSIPEATSASLLDESIRGIQYLDGSSRKAGEGTRNYVMFEDSPINIADRYAIAPPMFAPSQDRALAASNKGFLDPLTVDEQRITTHNMDVNKQMANLGLLADPMYEYGNIIPAKTNIVTGETSLAFPAIARDMVRGLLDLANTRRSGVYNPTALMDVAL